jgi:hypothetical protein
MILCKEEDILNRENARSMLFLKLNDYHGAMWAGAALSERANVIRVIKLYPEGRRIDDERSDKESVRA